MSELEFNDNLSDEELSATESNAPEDPESEISSEAEESLSESEPASACHAEPEVLTSESSEAEASEPSAEVSSEPDVQAEELAGTHSPEASPAAEYTPPKAANEPAPAPSREEMPSYESAPPQNSYNPGYNPGQPYQPSRGYYQPFTNEYVYSPQPTAKKSGAGKVLIIGVVSLLSLFVVVLATVSAYDYFTYSSGKALRNGPYADKRGNSLSTSAEDKVPLDEHAFRNDDEEESVEEPDHVIEPATPVAIRDIPSFEQLAAPADAMSLPDIYDKVIPSIVGVSCYVQGGTQTGTGFVISEDGYIVTNAHVIEDYVSVMVVDSDLNEYEAEVIGYDAMTDIAVLRVDPSDRDIIPVDFGVSSKLRIGELAIAIGNPLGFDLYGTMTTGIISGLDRTITISDNTMNLLQTSASRNRGNSGGPLIDAYGRVIGITSAKVDSTYGESLGFAIPIDEAMPIIENLIQYGYVLGRPSIGISGQDVTELLSLYWRLPRGLRVYSVTPGSGAEAAGILPDDVIIGIQGETIKSMSELNAIKNQYKVGDTVTLTIYRLVPRSDAFGRATGESFDVDVVLGESIPG